MYRRVVLFDKFIRLLEVLRPKFYNKLTWFIVITGAFLLSSPFWESLLIAVLSDKYQIKVEVPNNELYGAFLIVTGLIYHMITTSIYEYAQAVKSKVDKLENQNNKEKAQEHDIKQFKKMTEGFQEYYLTEFISSIDNDHSYTTSMKKRIPDFVYFSEEIEYNFINEELNDSFNNFSKSLSSVLMWCGCHFFNYPSNVIVEDQRYCLYPELNGDRGGDYSHESNKKYDEYVHELHLLTTDLEKKYKEFRALVKVELYI